MKRSALILGATGLVGKQLVHVLSSMDEYSELRLMVRRTGGFTNPKIKEYIIDMNEMNQHPELFQVDDIFCCLGTTIKKAGSQEAFRKVDYTYPIEAARLGIEYGAKHYLVISSMGASKDSPFFYSRVKGELEETLAGLPFKSVSIFRPSLLVGEREEFRFGEKLAEWVYRPFAGILPGKLKKYAPVEGRVVAASMAITAIKLKSGVRIIESDEIAGLGMVKN
ncbi:oxidoreductase [Bacillus sp. EB01]|uniref:oxidoreductase n=1 Tax=Bacillus sp. EB01 TaxID=1347086 RepID=UPI0005C50752|nr:oxidoreductase [Bacillus sp. EB01]